MENLPFPLRFVPYLRPMVWGGRALGDLLHKDLHSDEPFGESWEISDHPSHHSVIAAGPLSGVSLRDLMRNLGPRLIGYETDARFPWLIKFLDASDWLSIQVHPDDANVGALWPGESGKTEAWFILDAKPGSRIFAGLRQGVGPRQFLDGLARGKLTELLHSFPPRPGQCVFLPAGTVHGLGGGVVLAEIQQTSDATFRLFDWNRVDASGKQRKLHIQEGLAAIDWTRGPVEPITVSDFGQSNEKSGEQVLVECPYFKLSYHYETNHFLVGGAGTLQSMIVLDGRARFGEEELTPGQVWLLPASLAASALVPEPFVRALVATLPSK